MMVGNTGFGHPTTPIAAADLIARGLTDMVSFGRPFIANPDLPRRIEVGAPLATYDEATVRTSGPDGYVTYKAAC
jgi:2,4-dienoyl-CoA reductase-like NADH-dependent reductase (Old Yellow Enzyme family)